MQQDALDGNLSDNSFNISNDKSSEESFDDDELGNNDNKRLFAEFKVILK